jgi:hypothetical protein
MPTEVKDAKPRRMHGITATPFEMPAGILPEQKQRESGRPWLISLFAIVYFVHAGVSLLLALVPWSDPESGLATFLIAHPSFVFSLFPRMIQPTLAEVGSIRNNVLQGLPVIFLILGVIYAFSAFKLWVMDSWWYFIIRWGMIFSSGSTVVKILVALSADYLVPSGPSMVSDATRLVLIPIVAWNLLVFCYFAMMPDVAKAYDSNG